MSLKTLSRKKQRFCTGASQNKTDFIASIELTLN